MTATAPRVVLDGETTGLNRFTDEFWEFAAVRFDADGTRTDIAVFVDHDPAKAGHLPEWFRKDHDMRFRPDAALSVPAFLNVIGALFAVPEGTPYNLRPHVYGAVPEFDLAILGRMLHDAGRPVPWHHHTTDLETDALGYLRGIRAQAGDCGCDPLADTFPGPPWDSGDLSRAIGVDPDQFARHTAMGDVQWAIAIGEKTGALPAVIR